jgi:regulator of sigma E protease
MQIQDIFHLIASNVLLYGGSFLLVLSILVFVHELGHYLVARWCGVRIDTFSIGFGREIWGFTDKRGTRWKFSLVPLGGYVKMFGDVDPTSYKQSDTVAGSQGGEARPMTEEERKSAFFAKTVWQRIAIVFAGPGINYLFAVILLAGLYTFHGQTVTPPQATGIIAGSAADEAGFKPHDMILAINGRPVNRFEDVRREVAVKLDTPTVFTIQRGNTTIDLTATPHRQESEDRYGFMQSRGFLGILSPGNGLSLKHIVAVEGVETPTVEAARAEILRRLDRSFTVTLDRGESKEDILINPLAANNQGLKDKTSADYSVLNMAEGDIETIIKHAPHSAVLAATKETYRITMSTLEAIGQMFSGTRSAKELGGIIRIGAIAGDMASAGIIALIVFTALLSINLGLINLFPIPMLDGGHLVMYFYEAVRGKPLSEQIQEYAFRFGLVILVCLMVFANLNDLMQLIL